MERDLLGLFRNSRSPVLTRRGIVLDEHLASRFTRSANRDGLIVLKQAVRRALGTFGVEVRATGRIPPYSPPVDFTKADVAVLDFVRSNQLTMVSRERAIATINACKHAVRAGIEGDFVECGVWRGGNAIAAKLTFENYGSDKRVWLFDTFAGMTAPTAIDRDRGGDMASKHFEKSRRDNHNAWCYVPLEDVRRNFERAGIDLNGAHFIKGDVAVTLSQTANLPAAISVLRLDTDWYQSTKLELEILYPLLRKGGSLLIDDFGCWEGSRKAVEEYIDGLEPGDRPLLHYTDHSGRMGVKP